MAINPNWPLIEYAWAPYYGSAGGTTPTDRWVELPKTQGTTATQRGRQYELDQPRSGELTATFANTGGDFDPDNTAGPWSGHILPYVPMRVRAQYPPTANLLTPAIATGGDLGGFPTGPIVFTADLSMYTASDPSGGSIVATGTAWQGGRVLQYAVPSGTAAGNRPAHCNQVAVLPGQTYTLQLQVRNITASTTLQVKAHLGWYAAGTALPSSFTYGSPVTLTGSSTAAWTQITVTGTAPAGAFGFDVGVSLHATAAAACTLQTDGWQLEKAAAASAWTAPGTWYPLYAGFIERYPSQWGLGGTYGTVGVTAVDAFSLLSQQELSDPLTMEIGRYPTRFLYKLDDPQGSTSAADSTGAYPALQIGRSKFGAGSLTFGNRVTATDATNGVFTGAAGPVISVANASPGTNLQAAASYLSLNGAGIHGPAAPTGTWTRVITWRYTGPAITSTAEMWTCFDGQRPAIGSRLQFRLDSAGQFGAVLCGPDPANITAFIHPTTGLTDGNWHMAVVVYDHASALLSVNVDGVLWHWASISPLLEPTGLVSDTLGNYVDLTNGGGTAYNWKGDLALAGELPAAMLDADITNLYQAWKTSGAGESTDGRYARILRYAGYTGNTALQTGLTTSMGPAAIAGQDAVAALQAVVDTEGGSHFVDRAGTPTFRARSARYNATVPLYTFGERTDLGEWPYEPDIAFDFDPTHVANKAQITQESTGQVFAAKDDDSIAKFSARTLTRTINSTSALECQDAAGYFVSRYKTPASRITSIRLHPSANPGLWPVCLALELGTRVRIMRRPLGAPARKVEAFVENIAWSLTDSKEAYVTLQCSPADITPYGVLASFHTTLASTAAAGATSVSINAGQDTTNLASQQLGAGQQLVLGNGTANAETVTIAPGGVGATSPGWTTVTLALTAATTKSHTAGDVVCEPLPAGVTDPTTWDAVSAFDAHTFAY